MRVSGTVSSWKTEEIGFEVAGRVLWVLEPGANIEGRMTGPDGNLLTDENGQTVAAGTPLAQVAPEHYKIAVDTAQANIDVAIGERDSAKIRLEDSIPAEKQGAQANLELAESELARAVNLKNQNAISESELKQKDANKKSAEAKVLSLNASQKEAEAQLASAEANVNSAQQRLEDANRDLRNTTLYGSYRGQISEVHVVPGSVVSAGTPVMTLQMMDPIRIEVELSAEQSHRMRRRRVLPVTIRGPAGPIDLKAYVYRVDASANKGTRTFTLTLLLRNMKTSRTPPESVVESGAAVAWTTDLWPLELKSLLDIGPGYLVEENSIHTDQEGQYIWKITNAELGELLPEVLQVEKLRVDTSAMAYPLLGNWNLRPVEFLQPASVNNNTLIAGSLEFTNSDDANTWDGGPLVVDTGLQWVLRPGDLALVDLGASPAGPGYYIPISAVFTESETSYVFVVEDGKVNRLEVAVVAPENLDSGGLVEIQSERLSDGMQIVDQGVHFLIDGESVNVVRPESDQ